MRFNHFFCCLPLRLGVALFATLSFFVGGAAAIVCWIEVPSALRHDSNVATIYKVAITLTAALYSILTIISLFGLIGTIRQKLSYVSAFRNLCITHFILALISGAFTLYAVFSLDKSTLNGNNICTTLNGVQTCSDYNALKVTVVVIYVVIWLADFYGVFLVHSYVQQLRERDRGSYVVVQTPLVAGPYVPIGEKYIPYNQNIHTPYDAPSHV